MGDCPVQCKSKVGTTFFLHFFPYFLRGIKGFFSKSLKLNIDLQKYRPFWVSTCMYVCFPQPRILIRACLPGMYWVKLCECSRFVGGIIHLRFAPVKRSYQLRSVLPLHWWLTEYLFILLLICRFIHDRNNSIKWINTAGDGVGFGTADPWFKSSRCLQRDHPFGFQYRTKTKIVVSVVHKIVDW